ncbi:hypothetical protein VE04_08700, partial [Pseudogymnoascus sp. 24MN13]
MATETPKPIHAIVLDAAPIITNTPPISTLLTQATELYSVPQGVLAEIGDVAAARPSRDYVVAVFETAHPEAGEHQGGDGFCETGAWGTKIPVAEPVVVEAEKKDVEIPVEVAEVPVKDVEVPEVKTEEPTPESTEAPAEEKTEVQSTEESLAALSLAPSEEPFAEITPDAPEEVEESESDEDDEGGWITPSNIKKVQAKESAGSAPQEPEVKTMQVACITSDFAMQNVLLRMNLNLLSPTMTRVRQLKTWVLRCHACFDVTKDMSKQFCSRGGKSTLLRVSCSTDKDGTFKVHLKKNKQWSSRGNVYSIPKPVAGSANTRAGGGGKGGWGQTLILAEDQKEY